MSAVDLPDGSVCTIDQRGQSVSLARIVDGEVVWGQAFDQSARNVETTHGPFAFAFDVVDDMAAHPDAYRRWWS